MLQLSHLCTFGLHQPPNLPMGFFLPVSTCVCTRYISACVCSFPADASLILDFEPRGYSVTRSLMGSEKVTNLQFVCCLVAWLVCLFYYQSVRDALSSSASPSENVEEFYLWNQPWFTYPILSSYKWPLIFFGLHNIYNLLFMSEIVPIWTVSFVKEVFMD